MATSSDPTTLRERKRLQAMRRVQEAALAAFAADGFDAVSVDRIAGEADVSPISIYRWFGTKEGIVLWDDYDPALFEAIAERLHGQPPLEAIRDGVVGELGRIYDADRALVLARTQLIHREPSLLAASMLGLREMEGALATLLSEVVDGELPPRVLAATATAALATAIDCWQMQDGAVPLATLVHEAFGVLEGVRWTI